MRVLVCGSRHLEDDDGSFSDVLISIHGGWDNESKIKTIIHGGARGVDTLAGNWAKAWEVPVEIYPADWDKHGKAAGPIRNKQMLDEGKPDLVIAFLAEHSKGTKNMIEQAQKAGVKVEIINI